MDKHNMSYEEAVKQVMRDLRGEMVSEAILAEALATYPEIGHKLQGVVSQPPKWAKAGLKKMVQSRKEAETEARIRDKFLYLSAPSQERLWQLTPQSPGAEWKLGGIQFFAIGAVAGSQGDWARIRTQDLGQEKHLSLSFEKKSEQLGIKIWLGFYAERTANAVYQVEVKMESLIDNSNFAGWKVTLIPGNDLPAQEAICNSEGQTTFSAVPVPDIDLLEVAVQTPD